MDTNSNSRGRSDRNRTRRERLFAGVRSIRNTLVGRDAREKGLALGVAAVIVLALIVTAGPASAVVTTITGDDEVDRDDAVTLEVTLEVDRDDAESISIDGHLLRLTGPDGATLEQVLTFDGESVDTTANSDVIDKDALRPKLKVTDVTTGDGDRAGYGYAEGEKPDREVGDGDGHEFRNVDEITYVITLNAAAFDPGEYDAQVEVVTEPIDVDYGPPAETWPSDDLETAFASNGHSFDVVETEREAGPTPSHSNETDADDESETDAESADGETQKAETESEPEAAADERESESESETQPEKSEPKPEKTGGDAATDTECNEDAGGESNGTE